MQGKRVISWIIFATVLIVSLSAVCETLSFKYGDGILGLEYWYEQEEDTVDLLILGSSHAFENVNTAVLYDQYGISSYVLAGSVQPFWNSWYYLKEALRTQRPKLVILEGYLAVQDFEYGDHSWIIKNNLGIKNCFARLSSIAVSAPEDKADDYIFSYRLWHSRYEEINESDFPDYYEKPLYEYFKGFLINWETTSFEKPGVETYQGVKSINRKEELYFRKIIELCQQQDIPVMVFVSPYVLSEEEWGNYRYLESVAAEYQVPFIDYNSEEEYVRMGIDFGRDMADIGHLNYLGNVKFTSALGEDVLQYVQLPDHRGDGKYASWEMNSRDIHARVADHEVAAAGDCGSLEAALDLNHQILYLYAISDTSKICAGSSLLDVAGTNKNLLKDGGFYLLDDSCVRKINNDEAQWKYEEMLDEKYFFAENRLEVRENQVIRETLLYFDGNQYINEQEGMYLFVYNPFTKSLSGVKQLKMDAEGNVAVVSK